ncbi:MAG TPA: Na/Pi symporter, partial [Terrimicrobiaceae bacterium]|nr:Na/Pi symporter [Terrimicrobiaceae bacterium]
MTAANSLILGLGFFFLGLQLIGENLRKLSGSSFRTIIKTTTHSPFLGAGLGVLAGAVMQSATAVTFILVSLTDSGLIKARAAAPIIIWSNVGLTALAFVTTLNIHPLVAYFVGGAGIALGILRIGLWQTVAGSLLGMGLILFGLQEMGTGAAPLKDAAWFQGALSLALAAPGLT